MNKVPFISIIVLNWNGRNLLRNCLNSLKKNTIYENYEVIVVDNNSNDGSVDMLKHHYPWVRVIKNRKNISAPTAMNQGIKTSKGMYLVHLDNDVQFIQKEWLNNLVDTMEADKNIASLGCQLLSFDAKPHYENKIKYVDNVCGSLMMIRRDAIDKVGTFDDKNFTPVYGDETDWNYRAKNFGYKNAEALNTAVVINGSDSQRSRGADFSYFLTNKHRLRAMLFNLSPINFLMRLPGLGLIFVNSIPQKTIHLLLKSYWENIKDFKRIIEERRKREQMKKLHF